MPQNKGGNATFMLSFYGNTGDFLYIHCVKDFKYYVCELVNIDTIPCPCPGVNLKKAI